MFQGVVVLLMSRLNGQEAMLVPSGRECGIVSALANDEAWRASTASTTSLKHHGVYNTESRKTSRIFSFMLLQRPRILLSPLNTPLITAVTHHSSNIMDAGTLRD